MKKAYNVIGIGNLAVIKGPDVEIPLKSLQDYYTKDKIVDLLNKAYESGRGQGYREGNPGHDED